MSDAPNYFHPTAIVEAGSLIGTGTKVWHHGHIRVGATIGDDCVLGKNVFVDSSASIGNRVKIQNNVSVYSGVHIGNDVFVGPAATFTNDKVPRAFNTHWEITETFVRDGSSIGANSTIVCGTTLGEFCMVAAGATVTRDVAPYQLVVGTPARHGGWVCRCGNVLTRDVEPPTSFTCGSCRS